MHAYRPPRHQPLSHATTLGILYAEDFGIVAPPRAPEPSVPEAPALTQADLDAACARAVAAAEAVWSGRSEQRRAEALQKVVESLAASRAQLGEHAEAAADGVARAALGMLAGALPDLCRAHGDQEVRALMRKLAPLLAARTRLVIRVHPGLLPGLQADIANLDDTVAGNIELRPANLPPGDVRLSWEDGSLVRDSAAIRAAMEESLAQLGLLEPPTAALPPPHAPQPENRSLAFAQ